MALRIAVLVKQIPVIEEMGLGPGRRLLRTGMPLEMSAFCRRAVSKAVELAGAEPGSSVTVVTLGPPSAEDVLREAVAWGLDRDVEARGVLITDPAFAGSDTIATARALAAALGQEGPFDLVLTGRNSLDADTGQVPPQVAELLDLPFAAGVKQLARNGATLRLGCELQDAWAELTVGLPAVVSCAERLCEPAKVPPDRRARVPGGLIRAIGAAGLGPGPWGEAGSLTSVGEIRPVQVSRSHRGNPDAPLATQVKEAIGVLLDRGALVSRPAAALSRIPATGGPRHVVAVLAEPHHDELTAELCGAAARLASEVSGSTVLLDRGGLSAAQAGAWGADRLVAILGARADEDVAGAVTRWARAARPWAILTGSTPSGREIASRVAVAAGAGLTGDAVDLEVAGDRLIAWKPAFGGQLVAAITASSPLQMATVRAGVLPRPLPREHTAGVTEVSAEPRGRVEVLLRRQEDCLEDLQEAEVVIGVGSGVDPADYPRLEGLRQLLGAQIGCTRKVTDKGWLPHARQIGITGRSVSPRLYVIIGASGKFNHMVGVRSAGTILAVNPDRNAPVWGFADTGIAGSWQETLPVLVDELRRTHAPGG
jgi:electron transfer flavoprotein alpha subunit